MRLRARGLYHRSGITPCPEGFYLVVEIIISQLCFDDAIDRANADALGGIVVSDTFDTGSLVDHVGDAIAFADGFGRAFGYACATGDAVFLNFHGHGSFSVKKYCCGYKSNAWRVQRQLTIIFYLVNFVT